jgi:uncharacterized Fe-S cluster-containing radical SAM superfamily protein
MVVKKSEMINPFKEASRIFKIVCKNKERKYYRFRSGNFYGGIATADCVGCFLNCVYCWAKIPKENPEKVGSFFSPKEVAEKLLSIAKRKGYKKVRISGNEPTLAKEHLLEVISLIPKDFLFILETNGILIDEDFAKELAKFKNLHVRVSIKGANEEMFSKITGAKPEFFKYQLRALKNLLKFNISFHPAIMVELYTDEEIFEIKQKLFKISPIFEKNLEFEYLILYPSVIKNLKEKGFKFRALTV